eukprot:m.50747 g.50747  ORF g.50747 m.50747 type:complete len:500 (+) comp11183_c0_seq1:108-1607(+)
MFEGQTKTIAIVLAVVGLFSLLMHWSRTSSELEVLKKQVSMHEKLHEHHLGALQSRANTNVQLPLVPSKGEPELTSQQIRMFMDSFKRRELSEDDDDQVDDDDLLTADIVVPEEKGLEEEFLKELQAQEQRRNAARKVTPPTKSPDRTRQEKSEAALHVKLREFAANMKQRQANDKRMPRVRATLSPPSSQPKPRKSQNTERSDLDKVKAETPQKVKLDKMAKPVTNESISYPEDAEDRSTRRRKQGPIHEELDVDVELDVERFHAEEMSAQNVLKAMYERRRAQDSEAPYIDFTHHENCPSAYNEERVKALLEFWDSWADTAQVGYIIGADTLNAQLSMRAPHGFRKGIEVFVPGPALSSVVSELPKSLAQSKGSNIKLFVHPDRNNTARDTFHTCDGNQVARLSGDECSTVAVARLYIRGSYLDIFEMEMRQRSVVLYGEHRAMINKNYLLPIRRCSLLNVWTKCPADAVQFDEAYFTRGYISSSICRCENEAWTCA